MSSQKSLVWVLLVAFIIAGGFAVYYYRAYESVQGGAAAQINNAQNQVNVAQVVSKVGQLIVLPQGETPTVATVVDPNLLRGQAFFANAAKGDLVLIYTSAKKAILYDPNMNKIIEVAPITIGNPAPVATPPATTPSSTKK